MEYHLLQQLANIATIRQHINYIVNSGMDRKNINPIQKVGKELDEEFVRLLLAVPEPVEVLHSISIESTTFDEPKSINLLSEEQHRALMNKKESSETCSKFDDVKFTKVPPRAMEYLDENNESIELPVPSETRPKIKTSKKAAKK
jgi:hypothetical protein